MKLSGFINICERKGEKAHKEAAAMGLKYKGFGYWVDPSSGKVTHKTEGDNLVPVEPDVETEKWQGDKEQSNGMAGLGGSKPDLTTKGATQVPHGPEGKPAGEGISSAEPGKEQAPKRMSWEPGADGSTCVNSAQPPGDVPPDTFVGKTNYYQWTAGPDGTNYQNVSYDNMLKRAKMQRAGMQEETDKDLKPFQGDTQNTIPGLEKGYQGARTRLQQIAQPGREAEGKTNKEARSALNKMRGQLRAKQIQSLLDIRDGGVPESWKGVKAWQKAIKLPAIQKDADMVDSMNNAAYPLMKDPDFDLDQYDDDEFEDGGAFGQVLIDGDKVIKKGTLGPTELKALYAMRDNPNFPTLINGRFDGPFKFQSSEYNNPNNADNDRRPEGQQNYWDPDEKSDFEDRFAGAPGIYAMTRAKGRPLYNAVEDMDEEEQEEMVRKFWKARAALHMKGYSHNDMHGGNIFVDDEGNPTIIDLGLASDDPVSALMEALGGADFEEGGDYQLAYQVGGSYIPEDIREKFVENRLSMEEMLFDNTPSDDDDYDDVDDGGYSPSRMRRINMISDLMRGDIRMRKDQLDDIRETLPFLQDRKNVMKLMATLYDGIYEKPQSELEKRMSAAFSQRQQDSRLIDIVNKMRKEKGKSEIEVKNKNVIPPKNIDFDD